MANASSKNPNFALFLAIIFIITIIILAVAPSGYLTTAGKTQAQPITVSVSALPTDPLVGQTVAFNANARSLSKPLSEIKVYVDGAAKKTCPVKSEKEARCKYATSYSSAGSHDYYATAKDNAGNTVQSAKKIVVVSAYPDFVITDLIVSNYNPNANDFITVTVIVKNNGTADYDGTKPPYYPISVGFYRNNGTIANQNIISLKVGESKNISAQMQILALPTTVKVVLDEQKLIAELNEANNEKSITFAAPDTTPPTVTVTYSPASPQVGQTIVVRADINDNSGFVTEAHVFIDSTEYICSVSAGTLIGTTPTNCAITTNAHSTLGTHTYYATAKDAAGNVGRDPATGTKSFIVSAANVTACTDAQFNLTSLNPNFKGYNGAAYGNSYVYFVPLNNTPNNEHGNIVRYNINKTFTANISNSWQVMDTMTMSPLGYPARGYSWASFDGRYVYFAPAYSGNVVRYDTTKNFTHNISNSWQIINLQGLNPTFRMYTKTVFINPYVYFIPAYGDNVPYYDINKNFTHNVSNSWQVASLTGLGISRWGNLTAFDGNCTYYVVNNGLPTSGKVARTG